MMIEALINGEVLTHVEVPDEYLQDIEGASWQQNADARQQIVNLYLEAFQKKMEKVFNQALQVQYCLVFKSKLNLHETDERAH